MQGEWTTHLCCTVGLFPTLETVPCLRGMEPVTSGHFPAALYPFPPANLHSHSSPGYTIDSCFSKQKKAFCSAYINFGETWGAAPWTLFHLPDWFRFKSQHQGTDQMGKSTGGWIKFHWSGVVFPKGLSEEDEIFVLVIRRHLISS